MPAILREAFKSPLNKNGALSSMSGSIKNDHYKQDFNNEYYVLKNSNKQNDWPYSIDQSTYSSDLSDSSIFNRNNNVNSNLTHFPELQPQNQEQPQQGGSALNQDNINIYDDQKEFKELRNINEYAIIDYVLTNPKCMRLIKKILLAEDDSKWNISALDDKHIKTLLTYASIILVCVCVYKCWIM